MIRRTGILLLISLFTLVGCKSKKGLLDTSSTLKKDPIELAINNQVQYDNLSSKLEIRLALGTNKLSAKGEIRMVKDSAIQISVQPFLGIEVLRIGITPSSVLIVDRVNKRYLSEEFGQVEGMLPKEINFETLQAILSNRLFLPNKGHLNQRDAKEYKIGSFEGQTLARTTSGDLLNFVFTIAQSGKLVTTVAQTGPESEIFICNYNEFRNIGNYDFPTIMKIMFDIKGESINSELKFSSIDLSSSKAIDLTPPARYQRMTLQELITTLTKLK
ncbi:MAG: DUF4292 domain-containing protein [Bacteroidales bacterium]